MNSQPSPLRVPSDILSQWAATKPTIRALYVFGSYARGEATRESDLDLAVDVADDDVDLVCNSRAWRAELAELTGLEVGPFYHVTAKPVASGLKVLVFSRNTI
jgi:predicted nucleotidyltransferase